jgi:carbonic anhydrase
VTSNTTTRFHPSPPAAQEFLVEISRRSFMLGAAGASALAFGATALGSTPAWAAPRPDGVIVTPQDAIDRLIAGNNRWANGRSDRRTYAPPGQTPEAGQWPFAAILSCADSRVVPEDLFDVAGKNLFILRNAGNIVDANMLGSVEYAIEHTGISLVVALGHTHCGAVNATAASIRTNTMPGGYVDSVVNSIKPALEPLPAAFTPTEGVRANAQQSASQFQNMSKVVAAATAKGKVGVVQAYYDITTRRVTFF